MSGILAYVQKERWGDSYTIASVYSVGTQRIELRDQVGAQMFAELRPTTRVLIGARAVAPSELRPGMTVVIFGNFISPDKLIADVIRVMDHKLERKKP